MPPTKTKKLKTWISDVQAVPPSKTIGPQQETAAEIAARKAKEEAAQRATDLMVKGRTMRAQAAQYERAQNSTPEEAREAEKQLKLKTDVRLGKKVPKGGYLTYKAR